jgi:tRNA threonylcarbamoyladenosine biosynthesis protein TsaE
MQTFYSKSVDDTINIGKKLAETLTSCDILLLSGELGAGKTHLVKGIAAGLGVTDVVLSPTFCIHQMLSGVRLTINHFDFYRIIDSEEIVVLGLDEFFRAAGSISIIEWWQNASDIIPTAHAIEITITKTGDTAREIAINRP